MEILAGILVSILIEANKHYGAKLNSFQTLILVFVLSLIGAGIMYGLQLTGHWDAIIQILLVAGGTHNLIIRRLSK